MDQQAASTGVMRSSRRTMATSGHRFRAMTIPVGTAKSRPPNDERPPCQMAKTVQGCWLYWPRLDTTFMVRAPMMAAAMTHRNMPVTHSQG